jgi:hypothetical protein
MHRSINDKLPDAGRGLADSLPREKIKFASGRRVPRSIYIYFWCALAYCP